MTESERKAYALLEKSLELIEADSRMSAMERFTARVLVYGEMYEIDRVVEARAK